MSQSSNSALTLSPLDYEAKTLYYVQNLLLAGTHEDHILVNKDGLKTPYNAYQRTWRFCLYVIGRSMLLLLFLLGIIAYPLVCLILKIGNGYDARFTYIHRRFGDSLIGCLTRALKESLRHPFRNWKRRVILEAKRLWKKRATVESDLLLLLECGDFALNERVGNPDEVVERISDGIIHQCRAVREEQVNMRRLKIAQMGEDIEMQRLESIVRACVDHGVGVPQKKDHNGDETAKIKAHHFAVADEAIKIGIPD